MSIASSSSSSSPPPSPFPLLGPLAGLIVLDLSRLLPGPFASLILRDLGARVIKVEEPGVYGGDSARHYPPRIDDQLEEGQSEDDRSGSSPLFHALNRGKESVTLDLKRAADRDIFLTRLLPHADIVLDSFRPGVLDRLGLSPASLLARHPRLIVCQISGYGQTGVDRGRAGHDLNYLARAGVLGSMAKPQAMPVQIADVAGGSYPAAIQILAAVIQRDRTGCGAIIDVSMTDNAYALMQMPLATHSITQQPFGRGRDMLAGGSPCYTVYRTLDGHIAVGALETKFWSIFCDVINKAHLKDRQFDNDDGDIVSDVKQEVQKVMETKTDNEWRAIFDKADCCVEIGNKR